MSRYRRETTEVNHVFEVVFLCENSITFIIFLDEFGSNCEIFMGIQVKSHRVIGI